MSDPLRRCRESASQTAGPFVYIGLTPNFSGIDGVYPHDLGQYPISDKAKGERIVIALRVIDGNGTPLRDVLVESWQADARGLYPSPLETRGTADPHCPGWGRIVADMETGLLTFETVKPGRVPFADGRLQAPHLTLWIIARGINLGLHTRLYFSDEEEANAEDPVLMHVEHQNRVPTLIARKDQGVYRHDIHLQGDRETVFFDV